MRHSKINKHVIATGGQEHELKLFDIERQTRIFLEKNVALDWLQLRVPIWISDIDFLPYTDEIVTVGRYGHVRSWLIHIMQLVKYIYILYIKKIF